MCIGRHVAELEIKKVMAGGAAEILVVLARRGGFFRPWLNEKTVISNRVVNAVHPWPGFPTKHDVPI